MISQYITRHTCRFPPAVGDGVLDDPFLRPPPTPRCRRGCGRLRPPAKGEPPARVPPLTPSCASLSMGVFRALRRAAKGSAPGPRPLFCKKAGQKTFTWLDFRQPKPLAAAASDSIRPRSGHLSGRVAAPTRAGEAGGPRNLTGAPPPHKRFSLGLHPVSLGKTKEMGWNRQRKRKANQQQNGEFHQPQKPKNQEVNDHARTQDIRRKTRPL